MDVDIDWLSSISLRAFYIEGELLTWTQNSDSLSKEPAPSLDSLSGPGVTGGSTIHLVFIYEGAGDLNSIYQI